MPLRLDSSNTDHLMITFLLDPDEPPGAVSVVGSFNGWTPGQHELRSERDDPMRRVTVAVPYDEPIHFRYLAHDGVWFDEPDADDITERGSLLRAVPRAADSGAAVSAPAASSEAPKKRSRRAAKSPH
jgi:hypothetical protein